MKISSTLHLSKQKFKFSSGHFLIFDETRAEKLHGHNYSVHVRVTPSSEEHRSTQGYWVDFTELKKIIQLELDKWDEHVLLPALHPDMKVQKNKNNFDISFRERFYSLPQSEVILLPVVNTSVEELSRLLAEAFIQKMQPMGVGKVWVLVEETPGQGASTEVRV